MRPVEKVTYVCVSCAGRGYRVRARGDGSLEPDGQCFACGSTGMRAPVAKRCGVSGPYRDGCALNVGHDGPHYYAI